MAAEGNIGIRGHRPAAARRLGRVAVGALAVVAALATGHVGTAADANQVSMSALAGSSPLAASSTTARSDRWERYLADEATCPGGESTTVPLAAQVRTMTCLINYARAVKGVRKLRVSPKLSVAARRKAEDIQRCGVYDHAPCGGSFAAGAVKAGYSGSLGENLLLGEGYLGSPRHALAGWLASPGHRANVFSPLWRVQSAYVARVAELDQMHDAALWVTQFGDR